MADFILEDGLDREVITKGMLGNFIEHYDLENSEERASWSISLSFFKNYLNKQFPFLRILLKKQFEAVFTMTKRISPPSQIESKIISREQLYMLMFLTERCSSKKDMLPLFSSKLHGQSFHKMIDQIVGWPSPVAFILKISYPNNNDEQVEGVIGAMTFDQLMDTSNYYGNNNTFLFSLSPVFKRIAAKTSANNSNYMYINTNATRQK